MNPITPRVGAIHAFTVALIVILVLRLLFVQVLAAPAAKLSAEQTSVRVVYEPASRGMILDRNGELLASDRDALTISIDASRLPSNEFKRRDALTNIAAKLGMALGEVEEIVKNPQRGFYERRPLRTDVDKRTVIEMLERPDLYPGLARQNTPTRKYEGGSLAAHAMGHVGRIGDEELTARNKIAPRGFTPELLRARYSPDDLVGKTGIEAFYEEQLRGVPGARKIVVNRHGEQVDEIMSIEPQRGFDLVSTINKEVQAAAEKSLVQGTNAARRIRNHEDGELFKAPAGAAVAMDPRTGEVIAIASHPTFDLNLWSGPVPRQEIERINDPNSHQPQFNRAIAAATAPGSTFKPITMAAAWEQNQITPQRTFNCAGSLRIGNRTFKDWKVGGHGEVGTTRSLVESCDVVYYTLGIELNDLRKEGADPLYDIARTFGFGRRTGIDLPGESRGLVPNEQWKTEQSIERDDPINRKWFPGDSANLAIGQGALKVTPLQLARAYASIANGGRLVKPRMLRCIRELDASKAYEDPCGETTGPELPDSAKPSIDGEFPISPSAIQFMSEAMRGVVRGDGTAAAAFSGFPLDRVDVAGKSGTSQVPPRQDFSWFVAYAPAQAPEIVVAAMVEEGGSGSQIAAPIVRQILEEYFNLETGGFQTGDATD